MSEQYTDEPKPEEVPTLDPLQAGSEYKWELTKFEDDWRENEKGEQVVDGYTHQFIVDTGNFAFGAVQVNSGDDYYLTFAEGGAENLGIKYPVDSDLVKLRPRILHDFATWLRCRAADVEREARKLATDDNPLPVTEGGPFVTTRTIYGFVVNNRDIQEAHEYLECCFGHHKFDVEQSNYKYCPTCATGLQRVSRNRETEKLKIFVRGFSVWSSYETLIGNVALDKLTIADLPELKDRSIIGVLVGFTITPSDAIQVPKQQWSAVSNIDSPYFDLISRSFRKVFKMNQKPTIATIHTLIT